MPPVAMITTQGFSATRPAASAFIVISAGNAAQPFALMQTASRRSAFISPALVRAVKRSCPRRGLGGLGAQQTSWPRALATRAGFQPAGPHDDTILRRSGSGFD